jgi:hypothetical protein
MWESGPPSCHLRCQPRGTSITAAAVRGRSCHPILRDGIRKHVPLAAIEQLASGSRRPAPAVSRRIKSGASQKANSKSPSPRLAGTFPKRASSGLRERRSTRFRKTPKRTRRFKSPPAFGSAHVWRWSSRRLSSSERYSVSEAATPRTSTASSRCFARAALQCFRERPSPRGSATRCRRLRTPACRSSENSACADRGRPEAALYHFEASP